MVTQSRFLKNSEYFEDMDNEPMFIGTIDISGKIYDGKIFRKIEYGKEVLILCLQQDNNEAPF